MKTIIILATMLFVQQFHAQIDSTTTITVEVDNISINEGNVRFGLYSENTFMKSEPEYTATSKIVDGKAKITFEDVPAGTYAITCIHDINDNKRMDFEPTGMPKEYYGVSNNKFNPYGPPLWNDAKIEVAGNTMKLNLNLTR